MSVHIELVASREKLDAFARLPSKIYRGDPNWVPPLLSDFKKLFDRRKHPFHQHSEVQPFLALSGREPVGRIAAIWNRNHQKFHEEPVGFFGFFEALNDLEVASALFDACEGWLKQRGLSAMRGPASFSSNEEWALLVDGFDGPPKVMMTYNPSYYVPLLEKCGFVKARDLVAYYLAATTPPERLVKGADLVARRNPDVTVRSLRMSRFPEELATIRELYNKAWEKNWGFVPMTEAEIDHMARELKPVIDPDLVMIMEKAGKPIGFSLTLPDAYQALKHANGRLFPLGLLKILWHSRRIHTVRVLTLGLLPEHRRSGLDALLYLRIFQVATRKGYRDGEFSWLLEDNVAMRRPLENMGARLYRTYRVYERPIH
jgi:GNAT superfamily N-acetyltransferase